MLLNEVYDTGLPAAWQAIEDLQKEMKILKRHRHDPNNGDVLIRI